MEDAIAPFLEDTWLAPEPPTGFEELKLIANFPSDPFMIVDGEKLLIPFCRDVVSWVVSPPLLLDVSVLPGTNGTEAGFNVDFTVFTSSHFSFWNFVKDFSGKIMIKL